MQPRDIAAREAEIIRRAFERRTRMTVLEWADQRRWLSPEANAMAADAGGAVRYDSSVTPYHREPMLALSDARTEYVTLMFPSQDGKTEILNNFIGRQIDVNPGPMLVLQPTGSMAETWSKDRLAPMLRDSPSLRGKVKDARSRDANNTILHKKIPGGQLSIAGSNSAAELASRPIRDVCVDEVDRCAKSAGAEGDSIRLAFRRATTFRRGKKLRISSPTLLGASAIWDAYTQGTQEEWQSPCPFCGAVQYLVWGGPDVTHGLKWKSREEDPYYVCIACEAAIEERWKPWMIANGRYVAQNAAAGPRHRSFRKNGLTNALSSWRKQRDEWLDVQHKPLELQTFINTVLVELYDPTGGERLDAEGLFAQLETYPAEVPGGVGALARVVDTQDDRLETTVWGIGERDEMWLIDFELIPGNTSVPLGGEGSPWDELARVIGRGYKHEHGAILKPSVTFIDSGGHATSQVYDFVRPRLRDRVFAIKGANTDAAPLLSKPTRINHARVLLYHVGASAAKRAIQRRLAKIKRPDPGQPGPGYIHLPAAEWMDRTRLEQFTNEKLVPRTVDGHVKYVWVKSGPNELFDMAGYALSAFQQLGPRVLQEIGAEVARLRTSQLPVITSATPEEGDSDTVEVTHLPQRRSNWVQGSWYRGRR